ncbi:hypothetical protein RJ641_006056 [Dillenia turbinata]|uniref:Uncharacterized protein n=1 Tax=Dillenia turbinata TaxID=194707 RepID=A0AAN8Z9P8_9MAGN
MDVGLWSLLLERRMEASRVDQLKHDEKEMSSINYRQEKRVDALRNKVIYFTISYFIVQILVLHSLIASSSSSSLKCRHWWIPFSLSLLVSFLYIIAFCHTIIRFVRTQYQLDLSRLDHEAIRRELITRKCNDKSEVLKPDKVVRFKRYVYIYLVFACLLAFAAVMLFACRALLCHA